MASLGHNELRCGLCPILWGSSIFSIILLKDTPYIDTGCFLWIQTLISKILLPQALQWCTQLHVILDHRIMAPDCEWAFVAHILRGIIFRTIIKHTWLLTDWWLCCQAIRSQVYQLKNIQHMKSATNYPTFCRRFQVRYHGNCCIFIQISLKFVSKGP